MPRKKPEREVVTIEDYRPAEAGETKAVCQALIDNGCVPPVDNSFMDLQSLAEIVKINPDAEFVITIQFKQPIRNDDGI